ncbi:MAG: phosphatidylserine decarboxylase [Planctomycetota bacterium]
MRIPLTPHGMRELLLYALPFLPLAVAAGVWLHPAAAIPPAAIGCAIAAFFRDPERAIPGGEETMVSPADGTVMDIEEVDEPEFIGGRATRIGIFLSILSVHVNRSPVAGVVESVRRKRGAFHLAYKPEAITENEASAIGIAAGPPWGCRILVRQITGAAARRIVCPLEPGATLARGARFGMIKFGSRTEVWIPKATPVRIAVSVGDAVRGGSSVLAFHGVASKEGGAS